MNVRAIKASDYEQLKSIYEKYFSHEFKFPDFLDKYLCAFLIEEDGQIITAGGVRTITEAVVITNKDVELELRVKALKDTLTALMYISKIGGYDQLHAFVQDKNWKRHLLKAGFNPTRGESLVLEI